MNKEEIKHFKAMLRQGLLRHRDILLNEEFQKELLNIIKDYEKLQQENNQLKEQLEKKYEKVGTLTTEILYEENSKLQSVLKELRSWLEEDLKEKYRDAGHRNNIIREVLDKLNELEGGKNE